MLLKKTHLKVGTQKDWKSKCGKIHNVCHNQRKADSVMKIANKVSIKSGNITRGRDIFYNGKWTI